MKLVQWTPGTLAPKNPLWSDIDRDFENLMSWAFGPALTESSTSNGRVTRRLTPPMDLFEGKDHYEIRFDLPGLKKEDIDVTYQDGVLTVRGERKQEAREEEEGGKVVRQERYRGTFERTLRLPEKVDASRMSARFEDGVLELNLPLLPEAKPVRLQIQ